MNRSIKKKGDEAEIRLYTFEVFIIDGPIDEEFVEKNPVISRTIEIKGDQTLEDLHHAIFDAFDREEEHMYEFQIGGKGPHDPEAKRYGLPEADEDFGDSQQTGAAEDTTIDSLGLKVEDIFGYWFDFGDDWWHQINVVSIEEKVLKGRYPKVVKRVGKSPPQYPDFE